MWYQPKVYCGKLAKSLVDFVGQAMEGADDPDDLVKRAVTAFEANTAKTPKALVGFGWEFVKRDSIPDGGVYCFSVGVANLVCTRRGLLCEWQAWPHS